jgi:hypothetical protein
MRHQLSFTLPASMVAGDAAMGDVLLNYRFQVWTEEGRRPAFSPRISVILPSSDARRTRVGSDPGWQFNLPFSREFGRLYVHANAGVTWIKDRVDSDATPAEWTNIPSAAASANWAVTPMFQLMFETYTQTASQIDAVRENTVIVLSGIPHRLELRRTPGSCRPRRPLHARRCTRQGRHSLRVVGNALRQDAKKIGCESTLASAPLDLWTFGPLDLFHVASLLLP